MVPTHKPSDAGAGYFDFSKISPTKICESVTKQFTAIKTEFFSLRFKVIHSTFSRKIYDGIQSVVDKIIDFLTTFNLIKKKQDDTKSEEDTEVKGEKKEKEEKTETKAEKLFAEVKAGIAVVEAGIAEVKAGIAEVGIGVARAKLQCEKIKASHEKINAQAKRLEEEKVTEKKEVDEASSFKDKKAALAGVFGKKKEDEKKEVKPGINPLKADLSEYKPLKVTRRPQKPRWHKTVKVAENLAVSDTFTLDKEFFKGTSSSASAPSSPLTSRTSSPRGAASMIEGSSMVSTTSVESTSTSTSSSSTATSDSISSEKPKPPKFGVGLPGFGHIDPKAALAKLKSTGKK